MSGAAHFLTVGQLRAEMANLPDDTPIAITDSLNHAYDQGITQVLHSRLIEWDHDCSSAPREEHKPGVDCPTRMSLELWINSYEEAKAEAAEVQPDA